MRFLKIKTTVHGCVGRAHKVMNKKYMVTKPLESSFLNVHSLALLPQSSMGFKINKNFKIAQF